jgi:membrane glycosyltransferase
MNNLNIQSIKSSLQSLITLLSRYRVIIFVTLITGAFGFMIIRITSMATMEPTTQQKLEANAAVKVVKINEDTVRVIEQLQSRDIVIEALFEPGRYDPFTD